MHIKEYIEIKKKLIDKGLGKYLPSLKARPQAIHKAMRYVMFPGGKRIRPILTLAGFEACGGRGNRILPVACAIELIHSYTLIHDDLPCMDNDDYRRGRLSCHKRFNEGLALLTGDALLTLGFQLLSEAGNIDIIKEVSKTIGSRGTIGGQVEDIRASRTGRLGSEADLNYIATHKTGALFASAVKVGGIFKGAGRKTLDKLGNFGKCVGFTFQLVDDLIDRDGYVETYGVGRVRKMARLLTTRGKGYLGIVGKKGDRLSEIADLILDRHF